MPLELLDQDISAYIAGDDAAGGRICHGLQSVIRTEVERFLHAGDADHDDVVQDTLVNFLAYLRRAGRGPDRAVAFVVTMAGNRCRNLYRWRRRRPTLQLDQASDWLAGDGDDPLELFEAREREDLLRLALDRMDEPCRQLLLAIYADRRPMEELQREAGLGTVQGIYYRKHACLKKLARLLNPGLFGGRETAGGPDPQRGEPRSRGSA